MSPIKPETEQWEGRKGSRYGMRRYGQGRTKRKSFVVVGIKKKRMENVPLSVLRISGPQRSF